MFARSDLLFGKFVVYGYSLYPLFPGMCRLPRGGFQLLPVVSLPARHPVIFAGIFSCVKTATADLMVQHYVEKTDKINWHRGEFNDLHTHSIHKRTLEHGRLNMDTCCTNCGSWRIRSFWTGISRFRSVWIICGVDDPVDIRPNFAIV